LHRKEGNEHKRRGTVGVGGKGTARFETGSLFRTRTICLEMGYKRAQLFWFVNTLLGGSIED